MDEVYKNYGCQTGTKSLSTSLPSMFLSLFLSLPLCLHLHLQLLHSSWQERGLFCLTLSTKKVAEAPFLFHNLPLLNNQPHSHLIAVHFSLTIRLSLPIHLSICLCKTLPLLSASASWGWKLWFGGIKFKVSERERQGQESKRESVQECRRKWREKKGNSRRNGGWRWGGLCKRTAWLCW